MATRIDVETYDSPRSGTWFLATADIGNVYVYSGYHRSRSEAVDALAARLVNVRAELEAALGELEEMEVD